MVTGFNRRSALGLLLGVAGAAALGGVAACSSETEAPETESAGPVELSFWRSEEHTSELQSRIRISYAVFCLKKKN